MDSHSKKRINTITCHEVYNYGASLQEMALLHFLNGKGYEAKTISYKPIYLSYHHKLFSCANDNWSKNYLTKLAYICLKLPSKLILELRKRRFNTFSKKYIPSTKNCYSSNTELKNEPPSADYYICGSDQIWNHLFPNGKDPAFYLDFVPNDKIKISYAASFATDSIPEGHVSFLKSKLSYLDHISVRETSAKKMLDNLEVENVYQVLDPVFLLGVDFWNKFKCSNLIGNYIFIYDFDSNPQIKSIALMLKRKLGLKIVTMNRNIKYSDKNFYLHGPDVFLNLIANSQIVLTTSFHAVAFALIFNKKLGVFNRNININTRMRDLLQLMGIGQNLFTTLDGFKPEDLEIDYPIVELILEKSIMSSKKYLLNALDR